MSGFHTKASAWYVTSWRAMRSHSAVAIMDSVAHNILLWLACQKTKWRTVFSSTLSQPRLHPSWKESCTNAALPPHLFATLVWFQVFRPFHSENLYLFNVFFKFRFHLSGCILLGAFRQWLAQSIGFRGLCRKWIHSFIGWIGEFSCCLHGRSTTRSIWKGRQNKRHSSSFYSG